MKKGYDAAMDRHKLKFSMLMKDFEKKLWVDPSKIRRVWGENNHLTPKLCRMILAGLDWTAKDLSTHSGLRAGTISLFINGGKTQSATIDMIGGTFVNTGRVEIIDSDCVRVKPPNQ